MLYSNQNQKHIPKINSNHNKYRHWTRDHNNYNNQKQKSKYQSVNNKNQNNTPYNTQPIFTSQIPPNIHPNAFYHPPQPAHNNKTPYNTQQPIYPPHYPQNFIPPYYQNAQYYQHQPIYPPQIPHPQNHDYSYPYNQFNDRPQKRIYQQKRNQ